MNVLTVATRFSTQDACLDFLERMKWQGKPKCPYCDSDNVVRRIKNNEGVGRWNCRKCLSAFKVTSGTIFQGTKIPLPKWFAAITILLNAKKSVSSYQLARDLDMKQQTAWYMAMRIRKAMKSDSEMLYGIIEADETYIGGKPRGPKTPGKSRESKKTPVIGAVERGGKVKAEPMPRVTTKLINYFLRRNVDPRSVLVTDYHPGYNEARDWIPHMRINHSTGEYVDGEIYTNTIEGFWALVKRAIAGQHHHYTVEHAGMYIDEASYKYNTRKSETPFADFMLRAVSVA